MPRRARLRTHVNEPTFRREWLRLRRVTASCNADNPASVRVLEKAGMRREQHGVEDSWHADPGRVDGYQYALLSRDWHALTDLEHHCGLAVPWRPRSRRPSHP